MARKKSETSAYQQAQIAPERGVFQYCNICSAKFSFMRREHQCKRCYRAVCDSCATFRIPVYKFNFQKKVLRVCKICKGESDMILEYIESHGLKFKTSSETGRKWEQRVISYRMQTDSNTNNYLDFSEDMFEQLWNSLNYSLRQFVGIIVDGMSPKQIYKVMSQVLTSVSRRVEVKIQTGPYIVLMLLCFCSLNASTQIAVFLISGLKGYLPNKTLITDTFQTLGGTQFEISKLEQYTENRIKKFISMLSINMLPALLSKYIVQQMIVSFNPQLLIQFFCSVVFSQKQMVIRNMKNKTQINFDLIRFVDFIEVRRNFNLLKTGILIRVSFMKQMDQNSRLLKKSYLDESKLSCNMNSTKILSQSMQGKDVAEQAGKWQLLESNKKMRNQLTEYQHQLRQNQKRFQKYKQDIKQKNSSYNQLEKEKYDLLSKVDLLQKQKQQLRQELQMIKNFKFGLNRASMQSVDHSTTRISVRNPSIADSIDLQQLKKQIGLLSVTIKQKNSRIYHLSQENKRLSHQKFRSSLQFQELTNEQKVHFKKLQQLQDQRNKLQQQNQRLIKILEIVCNNMMNYQEDIIASNQETFNQQGSINYE